MRKLKNFIQLGMLAGLMTLFTNNVANAQVTAQFFGQNAWMPDTIGSTFYNGKLHQNWGNVKNSGATMVRFGGTAVDHTQPTKYQYIRIIDSIRAKGMEPMIQVPFNNWQYSAQNAASIVQYINVTKGRNVKYWVIGNEPDLAYSFTNAGQVAAYIKAFSSAMKAVDPTIKIVGPETAWFNQGILTGLTTPNGADDITGKDAAGRFYIDILSFHTYPFNGSQSRAQVISKLTSSGSLNDNLVLLNQRVAACNAAHNRTGAAAIKTAITEGNISYQNQAGDNNLYGVGTNSFIGGQFLAEMMCVAMKNNVSYFNLWSVIEGGANSPTNIGYIDPVTKNKKPLYHHFKMLADNFRGTYANGTTNQTNVKAFATKSGQNTVVMLMNQDQSTSFNYTLALNTTAIAGNGALKINIDAGIAAFHTDVLQPQSTVVLVFNSAGVATKKIEYTLDMHAAANLEPTVTNMGGVTTGTDEQPTAPGRKSFGVQNIYPIPSAGKFSLQVEKGDDARGEEFQVQLFNIVGQEVYSKKLSFAGGKEEIELSPSIAAGEYFVRVKEGSKENFQVKKIMIQK